MRWCFDRRGIDRINDVIESERSLRVQLIEIRREQPDKVVPPVVQVTRTGWSPVWVSIFSGVAIGVAFGTGYVLAKTL